MAERECDLPQSKLDHKVKYHGLRATRASLPWTIAKAFRRWLLTFAIVACFFAALQFYSERLPIMSSATEREFNTLITGLSIALGLSITLGFSEVISHLRWWILSRDYHSARKVRGHVRDCSWSLLSFCEQIDLIIQADSLQAIIGLATRTRRYSFQAAALLWLVLIVVSRIL